MTIKNDESFTSEAYAPKGAAAQQETYYRQLIEQVEDHAIFVLDPNGVIRARDEGVKVDAHGKDLVELLKRLQAE